MVSKNKTFFVEIFCPAVRPDLIRTGSKQLRLKVATCLFNLRIIFFYGFSEWCLKPHALFDLAIIFPNLIDAIDAISVLIELVVAYFVFDIKCDEQTGGDTHGESTDLDE